MELGLKLTRAADEFASEFQVIKDQSGPLFSSRENDTVFILTAHLKGYKANDLKIDINEDGTLISISGEKQVKETVLVGWKLYKNNTLETKGFKKVFRIPAEVNLDKIDANFNEDESTLTVSMPKNVKGIRGTEIEEVDEKADLVQEGSQDMDVNNEGPENQTTVDNVEDREREDIERVSEITTDIHDENGVEEGDSGRVEEGGERNIPLAKKFKMCVPIVASSMLVLSFVVFVFKFLSSKNLSSRRRD